MNEFVESCRREWRRLRVPAAVADELAAELEADLADAEADGLSREEALGGDARDPRSFARAWALARGVARPRRASLGASTLAFAAVTISCAVAAAGAALALSASPQARPGCASEPASGRVCARPPVTLVTMSTGTGAPVATDTRTTWVVEPAAALPVARADRSVGFALLGGGLAAAVLALALGRGLRRRSEASA